MLVTTVRDIAAGEELTLSYVPTTGFVTERQAQLKSRSFLCACTACTTQDNPRNIALFHDLDSQLQDMRQAFRDDRAFDWNSFEMLLCRARAVQGGQLITQLLMLKAAAAEKSLHTSSDQVAMLTVARLCTAACKAFDIECVINRHNAKDIAKYHAKTSRLYAWAGDELNANAFAAKAQQWLRCVFADKELTRIVFQSIRAFYDEGHVVLWGHKAQLWA